MCSHRRNPALFFSRPLPVLRALVAAPSGVSLPRASARPRKSSSRAARGTQPSSKNTSRSADPKSESTPRISRAILSDQRAIGLTIFLFVALAAQVIFKATFGNGDSNMHGLFSRVTYLLMRAYRWPQACLDHQTINAPRSAIKCRANVF